MRIHSAALVAGFATVTTAFLITPEIANDAIKDTRFEEEQNEYIDVAASLFAEYTEWVNVDCRGCPFPVKEKWSTEENAEIAWLEGLDSVIPLTLSTDETGLKLNGRHIHPLDAWKADEDIPVMVKQQLRSGTQEGASVPLNFAVGSPTTITVPDPSQPHLGTYQVMLFITALGDQQVNVDMLKIDVIMNFMDQTSAVVRVQHIPRDETPADKQCEDSGTWNLCSIRAMITAKLTEMIEAAKHRAQKMQSWAAGRKGPGCGRGPGRKGKHGDGPPPPPPPHDEKRPHHDHGDHHRGPPHPHPHHHHRGHRLAHILHTIIHFVVIPAVLGIIGGLTASFIGMLVGQAIVYLWRRTYRAGQRGPLRVVEQEIIIVEDEKDALLNTVEVEDLPPYQDSPVVVEVPDVNAEEKE